MTSPITWDEDELYGRYEIKLTADVGNRTKMIAASSAMRDLAKQLDVLGFELDVVYVIGSQRERN